MEQHKVFPDIQNLNQKRMPWTTPFPGWIKLNVDAGFVPNTRHVGLGFIARNHLGNVAFVEPYICGYVAGWMATVLALNDSLLSQPTAFP
ncbi:Os06g0549801 [Oryza sativa Japonica Group]|uniref:Os06g0549801 protein n=1 Tax=Oryza sativa subsp. japonica TaxID=39947 RepID=A0A0P0WXQ3_ORYSJ|nr:Os06g0549801 [Oryza sativa Japonica Group]